MTHVTRPDGADVLARVGRHWGWTMAFGIVSVLAGVAVLVWPGRTLIVVAVLFGIQLVVTGIFRFVAAFASEDLTGGTRVLLAVLGVLSLIIGLTRSGTCWSPCSRWPCCSASTGSSTGWWSCSWRCRPAECLGAAGPW